jgi:Flp pilus assembly protein TadD
MTPVLARRSALAVLLVACAAVYLPSIDGEFVLDDVQLLSDPRIVDPFRQPAGAWLSWNRPVATFTFALNHLAVGLDPRGWHLTNVLVHCAVVALVWAFARLTLARARLARPEEGALIVAAVFGLHPLHSESVAYVTQRAESLASALYLAAFLLFLLGEEARTPRRRLALVLAATGLHVVGLATKPIVATLPVAWLLHAAILPPPGGDHAPPRPSWRWRAAAALPAFAASAWAAASLLVASHGSRSAGFAIARLRADRYLWTQLRVIPTYVRLLFWPAGLHVDWDFRVSGSPLEPGAVAGACVLAVVAAASVVTAVRLRDAPGGRAAASRTAAFGTLFFLLVLAPTSLVPLLDPLAEHRVYLASVGIILAVVGPAVQLVDGATGRVGARARLVAGGAVLAVAMGLGTATARRSAVWANPLALWADAAQKSPAKARVHANLGDALHRTNRTAEALESFRRARELRADGTVAEDVLLSNIVGILLALFRTDEARAEVTAALARSPRDPVALGLLVAVEYVSRNPATCERAAFDALAADPWNANALKYLGMVRLDRGDLAGALEVLRAAASDGVTDPMTYVALGQAQEQVGRVASACAAYGRAVELPGDAWARATARMLMSRLPCR